MKVKLFTHTDLDGVGCAIVAAFAFGEISLDVEYCDYHDVNEKINAFGTSDEIVNYDVILITDISVNQSVADALNLVHSQKSIQVVLLDHHESAIWLNKYEWAEVYTKHANGTNTAGVSMLLEYLFSANELDPEGEDISELLSFVEKIRRYDTWDWTTIHNDHIPKQLNDLFWLYGRDRFFKKAFNQLLQTGFRFTDIDYMLLEIEQERINHKINKALKQLTIQNVGRYNVGVVFAEDYQNDIAHAIHDEHPQLDLVAVVNMSSRKVSYRTQREDIDVNEFAQYFGGGGRPQTAGSQIHSEKQNFILDVIFSV